MPADPDMTDEPLDINKTFGWCNKTIIALHIFIDIVTCHNDVVNFTSFVAADKPDLFFRVNLTLSITGSPSNPQDFIKTLVSVPVFLQLQAPFPQINAITLCHLGNKR